MRNQDNNHAGMLAHQEEDAAHWLADTRRRIRAAADEGRRLVIEGSGSRQDFAGVPQGERLSLRAYRGIVHYEPDDLVITVRAGTPLADVQQGLAQHGQMLGFEPPLRPGATVGGAVALGWSGPRRPFAGALRDHMLGVRMLDGEGRLLRFGGQVVKNVAGFDVARLMAGGLVAWARAHGGHATLWAHASTGERHGGVFQALPAPVMRLHQRLKQVFDPRGVFNIGRMYPQF